MLFRKKVAIIITAKVAVSAVNGAVGDVSNQIIVTCKRFLVNFGRVLDFGNIETLREKV